MEMIKKLIKNVNSVIDRLTNLMNTPISEALDKYGTDEVDIVVFIVLSSISLTIALLIVII